MYVATKQFYFRSDIWIEHLVCSTNKLKDYFLNSRFRRCPIKAEFITWMNTFCRLYRFLSFFDIKLVNFIMSQIVSNDLLCLIDWNLKKGKEFIVQGHSEFSSWLFEKRGTSSTMMTIPLEKISSMSKHICECRTMTGVVPGSKWPVSSLAIF